MVSSVFDLSYAIIIFRILLSMDYRFIILDTSVALLKTVDWLFGWSDYNYQILFYAVINCAIKNEKSCLSIKFCFHNEGAGGFSFCADAL